MSWQGIEGHDRIAERFQRAAAANRLSGAFLFVGPPGVGKRSFAIKLAKTLLCEKPPPDTFAACGSCDACAQVEALTHPDLEYISRPSDRSFIPVEVFIGDREHRMREGLCHRVSLKPFRGGRKIALIDDADYLNEEGANCLLKTLEEPPPRAVLILIGESEQRQLPTIRSRCQTIRFSPLEEKVVASLLAAHSEVSDVVLAEGVGAASRLAAAAQGSVARGLELADPDLEEFRRRLYEYFSQEDPPPAEFVKQVISFVDQAGKEAPPRRRRMAQIMGLTADFYQALMRRLAGFAGPFAGGADPVLASFVEQAAVWWKGDEETAGRCVEHCLAAQNHIQANANQNALLEWWLDELSEKVRSSIHAE